MSGELILLLKKTGNRAIKKQVKYPRTLLFSLSLLLLFALTADLLKSNLDLSLETEKDLGKSFGETANSFVLILILPFVLWIYLKDLIVYTLEKIVMKYSYYRNKGMVEEENDGVRIYNPKKLSKSIYFTIRRVLLNIHCIGCLMLCIFVILHMISLFEDHNGPNFFFAWTAMAYGVYLSLAGLILRINWWKKAPLMKNARRIARGIHIQIIIAIVALIALNLHLSWVD